MGWHDPKLRAQAIRHLLSLAHLGRLWDEQGPTPEAVALRRSPDLPKQERALLEIAFDLWDGTGRAPLANVAEIDTLILQALGELLLAIGIGASEIDGWCDVALAAKLRAIAWTTKVKDATGAEDPLAEDALLEAANALEDLIEHHGLPSRRRASPPEART